MLIGKSRNNIYHALDIRNYYLCISAVGVYKGIVTDGVVTCKNCLNQIRRKKNETQNSRS